MKKASGGTGGYNGSWSVHWSARLKKGWIFERTSRCKGWSARARSSVDVACVLRKTSTGKRERAKALEKGARDDDPGKGAVREREIKKKGKECTRVHAQLSPLEYT